MLKRYRPESIGWQPYIYLVYLLFLFWQPLFRSDNTVLALALTAIFILCFLPLYFWSWVQEKSGAYLGIVAISLLGFIAYLFNSGSGVFYAYAAALSGKRPRFRTTVQIAIGLMLLTLISAFVSPIPMPNRLFVFIPTFIFTPLAAMLNVYETQQKRSNARLALANEEIERLAKLAERERIARDLHDLLGHTLSVITLKSELAHRLLKNDLNQTEAEIKDIIKISREALNEVRTAVSGYRQKGFMAEVASAKLALETSNVSFAFKGDASMLSGLQENTLGLVLREAVTNIIRHANATSCNVELTADPKQIELVIRDNGSGIKGGIGNGLSGMRNRISLLGGTFEIGGFQGTLLTISLPRNLALQTNIKADTSHLPLETS